MTVSEFEEYITFSHTNPAKSKEEISVHSHTYKDNLIISSHRHTNCVIFGGIFVSAPLSISLPTSRWAQRGLCPLCSHANVNINAKTLGIGVRQQSRRLFHTDLPCDDWSDTRLTTFIVRWATTAPSLLHQCLSYFRSFHLYYF